MLDLNEHNYRNQVNVIYSAPCKVVAAGEDRNLVQGSMPNEDMELKRLKSILDFGDLKQPVISSSSSELPPQIKRKVAQGSLRNLGKEILVLEKLLRFGKEL
jgi:hypothetical protein